MTQTPRGNAWAEAYYESLGGISLTASAPLYWDSATSNMYMIPAGSGISGYWSSGAQTLSGVKTMEDTLQVDGKFATGTANLTKQANINSADGEDLRLSYNDTHHVDHKVASDGNYLVTNQANNADIELHTTGTGGLLVDTEKTTINKELEIAEGVNLADITLDTNSDLHHNNTSGYTEFNTEQIILNNTVDNAFELRRNGYDAILKLLSNGEFNFNAFDNSATFNLGAGSEIRSYNGDLTLDVQNSGKLRIQTGDGGGLSSLWTEFKSAVPTTTSTNGPFRFDSLSCSGSAFMDSLGLDGGTSSTTASTGDLVTTGGVGCGQNLNTGGYIKAFVLTDSSASNSLSSLNTLGGASIAKKLYANLIRSDSSQQATNYTDGAIVTEGGGGCSIGGNCYISQLVRLNDSSDSTSKDSGALLLENGGAGIEKNLHVGLDTHSRAYELIEQASNPMTPTASKMQLFAKNDTPNTLYVTDDDGTDIRLSMIPAYSCMFTHNDASVTTLFSTGVFYADNLTSSTNKNITQIQGTGNSVTGVTDQGSGIVQLTTSVLHNLNVDDVVYVANSTSYNGYYVVQAVPSTTTFNIIATYTSSETAVCGRGTSFKIQQAGTYELEFSGGAVRSTTSPEILLRFIKNTATVPVAGSTKTSLNVALYDSVSMSSLVDFATDDIISVSITRTASTGDVIVEEASFSIKRIY